MGLYSIRLPDIGEGVAEAELVEWCIEVGQVIRVDDTLAAVMTDKATVEIPAPVSGKVVWFGPDAGSSVSVGVEIIRLEVAGEGNQKEGAPVPSFAEPAQAQGVTNEAAKDVPAASVVKSTEAPSKAKTAPAAPDALRPAYGGRPVASPAVRKRAAETGVNLRYINGTGPAGRITHADVVGFLEQPVPSLPGSAYWPNQSVEEHKVIGLRRRIAEKMSLSKSRIPHISYIEEVDVSALEDLRQILNQQRPEDAPKLSILPFLLRAMVRAIAEMPHFNARYDDEAGTVSTYGGVHAGIATQTDNGLVVPVVRHSEALGLWDCACEIQRITRAVRTGSAKREELSGSTITITSLGAMGGFATTPVINHPEVAIIGVNKIRIAPVWDGNSFVPRKVMNLSSSFDHRIIDGWNAALFVQRIKTLLESPAMIFVESP